MIYGMPRTGTSMIQSVIADQMFNLPNRGEPFNAGNAKLPYYIKDSRDFQAINEWARNTTDGVFKFLGPNQWYFDLSEILKMSFDHVILVHRHNPLDIALSEAHATYTGYYHYLGNPMYRANRDDIVEQEFVFLERDIMSWLSNYYQWARGIEIINQSLIPASQLDYDHVMNTGKITVSDIEHDIDWAAINTVPLQIDYRRLCLNLDQVQSMIDEYVDDDLEKTIDRLHDLVQFYKGTIS